MKKRAVIFLVLRVAVGAAFVISGFQKLTHPYQNFVEVIEKFQIIHAPYSVWVAKTLPWAEFLSGVFLCAGLFTKLALSGVWAMNTAFIVLLASSMLRKLPLDQCGCFGEAVKFSLPQMLFIDAVIWLACLALSQAPQKARKLSLDALFESND